MGSGRVAGSAPGAAGLTKIEPARPEPLGSEVARRLLDYLLSGQVRPGERIPSERQLAEDLGVNRPAVREAIQAAGTTRIAYRDHVAIYRAIAAGDPEAARTAMAAHMRGATRRLLASRKGRGRPMGRTRLSDQPSSSHKHRRREVCAASRS